jgi:pullulanase/glycogen debranching enzyme
MKCLRWIKPAPGATSGRPRHLWRNHFEKLDGLTDRELTQSNFFHHGFRRYPQLGLRDRFFFAPDIDAVPVLKLFVKHHQRGIQVILDIVMNHHREYR